VSAPSVPGFFEDATTLAGVIQRIAAAPAVTFIVGAGASMEAGLPSWGTLVARLLDRLELMATPEQERELRDRVSQLGVLEAAAMVRAWHADQGSFLRAVKASLYDGHRPDLFAPGPIASELGRWIGLNAACTDVATLNYNLLIERAVHDVTTIATTSMFSGRAPRRDTFAVRHLHGRLSDRHLDEIVLTERDYAVWQQTSWQERFMREALRNTMCVFVGLSFSDQNLLRWVYDTPRGSNHRLALFARQGAPGDNEAVRQKMELAADRRLARASVEIVRVNYYAELGQLIHEARRQRQPGRPPDPFATRASRRTAAATRRVLPSGTHRHARQQTWADALEAAVATVRSTLATIVPDLAAEHMGLGVWSADHHERKVTLLAASDRIYLREAATKSAAFAFDSEWIAIRALTTGVPVEEHGQFGGRWNSVRGVPLVWTGQLGRDRVPVGAFTLTSTYPEGETMLDKAERQRPGTKRTIDALLHDRLVPLWN
jgi:hypothetical protein